MRVNIRTVKTLTVLANSCPPLLAAPLPAEDAENIARALKVLADPEMKAKFAALGLDTVGSTPEETSAAIAGDIPKWAKVIKDANIKTGN